MNEQKKVERFNVAGRDGYMTQYHSGDYVKFTDYESLRRQLAEAEKRVSELSSMVAGRWKARADAAEAKLALAEQDSKRLDWLIRRISGKALRAIGVVWPAWSEESSRTAIDAAIAAGEGTHD